MHAGQAAESIYAQARVVGNGGQAAFTRGVTGFGQGVFYKGVKRLFGFANVQITLAHQLDTQRRKHGLQLGELAFVVRGQNDSLHGLRHGLRS